MDQRQPGPDDIFVFGSNLQGRHGAGAAQWARKFRGAIYGKAEGLMGQSYALPTCSVPGVPLPLQRIREHIKIFLECVRANPRLEFQLTPVGCGYAGYHRREIAQLFKEQGPLPSNVHPTERWLGYL
jgi:hypothetical protein